MKIKVKDLEFNPFRNVNLIPIDKETVDKLKGFIKDQGLRSGLEARPKNNDWKSGKYEIPYGHHRLIAIQEMGIKEIDIPVMEISDFNMVLRMVQENMGQRGMTVEMINGTVQEVKEFLDGEIAKYETWEKCSDEIIRALFEGKKGDFQHVKNKGVGRPTILHFLKGAIEEWRIGSALNLINSDDISIDAVNSLGSTGQVEGFKKAIRKVNKLREKSGKEPISKDKQKGLAKKIKDTESKGKTGGGNYYKSMEDIIIQETEGENALFDSKINDLIADINKINADANSLHNKIISANTSFKELGIENLENFYMILDTTNSFANIFSAIETTLNYFGIDFKNEVKKLKS
jgi:hypothetical protein